MIGPGTDVRVYLACGVTDMRKGIAGPSDLTHDSSFSNQGGLVE
jgi:transposase